MKGILIKANDTIQSSIGSQNAIISAVDKLMDSYQNYLLISEQDKPHHNKPTTHSAINGTIQNDVG